MTGSNPDFLLNVVAALAGFLLKTTVGFAACLALSRLVVSANFRFVIWSGFVYGSAAYWLYLADALLAGAQPPTVDRAVLMQPPNSGVGAWQISTVWAFPLGLTLRVIGIVYLLALCYLVFTHLRKRRNLKWVLTFTSEPPVYVAERFASLAKKLHVGRSKLLILSGATSPATFGWIRPTILLPNACLEDDPLELEDVLRHELHHVRRWDALWNGFALASRTLLFFHPGVWYAVRQMQFDRELACDHAVISQSPARRGKYAECLVRFARLNMVQESSGWGIDFAASAEQLTLRVHSILAGSKKSPRWALWLRIASGVTISGLFLGIAPSMAVLLSFAHEPVAKDAFIAVTNATRQELRPRANKKARTWSSPAERSGNSAIADVSETEGDPPSTDLQPYSKNGSPATQSSSGPQLHRRGDASAMGNSIKQQTVALVDTDANGQPAKPGNDKGAAVQQTATAVLGMYRRVSSLDRH